MKCVIVSPEAQKQLFKCPNQILRKLLTWIETVERYGIEKARMRPGTHDEPLKGKRKGQRSIRLTHAYRAIYEEKALTITIIEVNKHDY